MGAQRLRDDVAASIDTLYSCSTCQSLLYDRVPRFSDVLYPLITLCFSLDREEMDEILIGVLKQSDLFRRFKRERKRLWSLELGYAGLRNHVCIEHCQAT